jgi:hypothetical protein
MNHFESSVINLIWIKKLVLLYSCLNAAVAVTNDTECFELIFGKELICKCKYSIKTHNTESFSNVCYNFSCLNVAVAVTNDT